MAPSDRHHLAVLTRIPTLPAVVARVYKALDLFRGAQLNTLTRANMDYLRLCVFLVFLVNAGSWPFVWHIRVFWPIIVARIRFLLLRASLLFKSPSERNRIIAERVEALCPVGSNPFELVTTYRRWASIDDVDMFGMHLSNSSYAKALDSARLRVMWKAFPAWSVSQGVIALGATHYHFIREIPMFARYEVRISIAAWDQKWLYVIARYVTPPKRRRTGEAMSNGAISTHDQSPADSDTNISSPNHLNLNGTATLNTDGFISDTDKFEKTLNEAFAATNKRSRTPIVEPDGSVLHCIAVSQLCFKQGRISVPPAVALACEGFCKPPVDSSAESGAVPRRYSASNPPPHWAKVRAMRVPPTGSMKRFKQFLAGGWKTSAEETGDKWWEEALSGPIEEKRKKNLEVLHALRARMEGVRGVY
ncbi:hypothetical protein M404DRAFT_508186 [Pisolithus tinctorius Marx 270]|uniref:Uncharacterized protein n=1 Tax=Pisolithus tinctorius Marx 270 TaxID=870435 RepID=A0A0C3K8L4_PISTI|nr:hypothetical protein M404DRAFT_508186 [Pisolithus tinctorius Marx 270]